MATVIALGLVAVLLLLALGIPIYLVLMGVASTLLVAEGRTIAGLGQHVLDHLQSPILISVPFFILSAVLMQGGGLARVLFDAALAWIGWIRGGLAIAGVAATAVFAAITGSSAATTMAMGTLLVPLMQEKGYKTSFAMGLTAAAGTLGILIPPSLPMILFGLIAEESIPRLFLGGVIPGLMQAGLFAAYIFFVANKVGGKAEPMVGARQFVRTNVYAFPAYLIPIVVLGGIYGGFVTLTEAAVLGVLCALVAVLFVYRSARLRDIPKMLTEAIDRTSVIILIIMGATLVSGLDHQIWRSSGLCGLNHRSRLKALAVPVDHERLPVDSGYVLGRSGNHFDRVARRICRGTRVGYRHDALCSGYGHQHRTGTAFPTHRPESFCDVKCDGSAGRGSPARNHPILPDNAGLIDAGYFRSITIDLAAKCCAGLTIKGAPNQSEHCVFLQCACRPEMPTLQS